MIEPVTDQMVKRNKMKQPVILATDKSQIMWNLMTESRVKIVLLMIKVYILMSNIIQVFYFNEVYFGVNNVAVKFYAKP